MSKVNTNITLDAAVSLIRQRRDDTRSVMRTFGSTPAMDAKLNAYDYCLQTIGRVTTC